MIDQDLRNFAEDLESVVVQLIFDEAQGSELDLSDARIRRAIVNALAEAAQTFDRSDEEWKEVME